MYIEDKGVTFFYFYRKALINASYLDVIMLTLQLKFHARVRNNGLFLSLCLISISSSSLYSLRVFPLMPPKTTQHHVTLNIAGDVKVPK